MFINIYATLDIHTFILTMSQIEGPILISVHKINLTYITIQNECNLSMIRLL